MVMPRATRERDAGDHGDTSSTSSAGENGPNAELFVVPDLPDAVHRERCHLRDGSCVCPLCFHGGPDTRPWSPLCPRAEAKGSNTEDLPFHVLQCINNCYNLDQPQPQDEVVLSPSELAFGSQFPNNVPIIGEMLHLDLTDSSARLPREPEFDFSRKGVDFPRENQLPQLKDESLSMILDKFRTLCIPDSCSPSPQTSQTPKIPLVLAGSSHTDNQLKSQGVFKRPINIGNARGSGKKRVKPNSDSSRSNPESQRKLACPFYARDPESHKHRTSCYKTGFPNTTRVKEHCFRYHLLLLEDGRADTKVAKKGAVTKRIKSASAGTCKTIANADDNAEVISMKLAQLRDRRNFRDGEPPEANWQRIYRICFPGERIPSPFWVSNEDEHGEWPNWPEFSMESERVLSELLEENQHYLTDVAREGPPAVCKLLWEILMRFRQRPRPHEPTPGLTPSGSSDPGDANTPNDPREAEWILHDIATLFPTGSTLPSNPPSDPAYPNLDIDTSYGVAQLQPQDNFPSQDPDYPVGYPESFNGWNEQGVFPTGGEMNTGESPFSAPLRFSMGTSFISQAEYGEGSQMANTILTDFEPSENDVVASFDAKNEYDFTAEDLPDLI